MLCDWKVEMGKNPNQEKNEPNQNPGFAKNRSEPEPKVEKNVHEPELNPKFRVFPSLLVWRRTGYTYKLMAFEWEVNIPVFTQDYTCLFVSTFIVCFRPRNVVD